MPGTIRIAMWSGPRNISTAMMRAWENRPDTAVVDEPFYACYLTTTGIVHPMQKEVLASQSSDWNVVIDGQLSAPLQPGQTIQYQKHMTHHMVSEINEQWFGSVRHAFLIRHPGEVVSSYSEKRQSVTAEDIGFERQMKLYQMASRSGNRPPVLDAGDVLKNPRAYLGLLCSQLDVPFDNNMLQWPAGSRDSDGAWSPHWYNMVEKSTGFAPYSEKQYSLSCKEQDVVAECLPFYDAMFEYRIRI